MTSPLSEQHPLRRLFAGTIQQVFYSDIGMCDPQVADYVADLLSGFIHADDLYPFCDAQGRRLEDMARLVTEAQLPPEVPAVERQRLIHKHIGDFTLFWTGLFPEGLRRVERRGTGGSLKTYLKQGKRSYSIASELTRPEAHPPAGVFRRLSEQFEYCVYGLHLCRKEWDTMRELAERS